MRKPLLGAATIAVLWTASAAAVHVEEYPVPYFGVAYGHLLTDAVRNAGDGTGLHLTLGVPLQSGVGAVELRFFDSGFERFDGRDDYQTGLMVDYVRDFGTLGAQTDGFFGGVKPFVSAGIGFIEEDARADKHLHVGASVGGGVLLPLGFNGVALRLDGRVQPQLNDESCPNDVVCDDAADVLVDYQVNLGLQLPMTAFFDRPVAVAPADECPLAVVDPDTGRRDCATDSDGDGVLDGADQCPASAAGTQVDAKGCPRVAVSTDDDKDGVQNRSDRCPGTQAGLQVDEEGCVVAQKTAVQGVTFQPNSAQLTEEGRRTLDGVAATLKEQEDLKVEIAGHTDSVGSEAYNTLLSQQRADAVRAYLVAKGIEERRMAAVGYGELEPVASNETEPGRRANRRVEFRITTD